MILLWGIASDHPLAAVRDELWKIGAPAYLLDQRAVLEMSAEMEVSSELTAVLRTPDGVLDMAAITAAYLRPYDARDVPVVAGTGWGSAAWHYAGAIDDLISAWSEVAPALIVNHPSAMASNGSKPYQLEKIREAGLGVPETLITTDPEAARAFWHRCGEVIYKSVSGVRSRVSRLRPEHDARLADVVTCPTQFQQYVPGRDYRVHVVGERTFACEIASGADDYRYPSGSAVDMRACELPGDIEALCVRAARLLNLAVAGLDLRRSPEGQWFCFEVNPSPAFTYFEAGSGQPIGRAVAELLASTIPEPHRAVSASEVS